MTPDARLALAVGTLLFCAAVISLLGWCLSVLAERGRQATAACPRCRRREMKR